MTNPGVDDGFHTTARQLTRRLGGSETLVQRWCGLWSEEPDAVALVDAHSSRALTRAELDAASAAAAANLHGQGLRRGDRLLLSASPSVELVICYVATLRLGVVVVPANTGYRDAELAHLISDSGASLAVVDDPARLKRLPVRALSVDQVAGTPPSGHVELPRTNADGLAMIAYTSGTTGRPKGAMLTHRNLLASADALRAAWEWRPSDGLLLALPLFHLHGLGVGVNGSLSAGAKIILCPRFDARETIRLAARSDVTLFFGVPTMFARLDAALANDPSGVSALASLRLLVSGSAPLAAELWQRLRQTTGQEVLERYGMTETVMLVSNPYRGERRAGSVGVPLPGVEVALGPTNEILVRGPNVTAGYWRDDEATREAFTPNGFFRTGDIGEWSSDGYLSIVGRIKELIISGGYNVYPREVEEALARHPGVRDVGVAGAPSAEWGEEIVAVVAPADPAQPPTLEDLAVHCSEQLAAYKKPRRLVVVDTVPRNAMGKIARAELAALL